MKVLQIPPYYRPHMGGVEKYVENLSKQLIKKGVQVDVLTSNYPKTKEYEIIDGIGIERLNCIGKPLRTPLSFHITRLNNKIKQYDIIHIHNEHNQAALLPILNHTRFSEKPLIMTCHGQVIFGNFFKDVMARAYDRIVGKASFSRANRVIALSNSDKNYIASLGIDANKIQIIPNAIDTEYFDAISGNAGNLRPTCSSEGKYVVIFVGAITKRKGVDYLVRAVPLVEHALGAGAVKFIIIGSGTNASFVKQLVNELGVKDSVTLTGPVGEERLICLYQQADLFILPSLSEGMPTTILEAMYFHLPVISTNIAGIRDHFSDTAVLVPPSDEKRIAQALIDLLQDEASKQRLAQLGYSKLMSNYTWEKVAEQYFRIYNEMISNEQTH